MLDFVQQLVSGIALGCVYGLIALGFVLVYKATEVVNFAQGDLMMLGGFFAFTFIGLLGFNYWIGFAAAVAAMALFGMLAERLVVRPILGYPQFSIIMATIGLGYFLRSVVGMIWGTDDFKIETPFSQGVLRIGSLRQTFGDRGDHHPLRAALYVLEPEHARHRDARLLPYVESTRAAIKYMIESKNFKKPCLMHQDDEYGKNVLDGFSQQLDAMKITPASITSYKRGASDFSAQVAKMKSDGCDMIVLGTVIRETIGAMSEAKKLGWDVTFLGATPTNVLEVPTLGKEAVEGLYAASGFEIPYEDTAKGKVKDWLANYKEDVWHRRQHPGHHRLQRGRDLRILREQGRQGPHRPESARFPGVRRQVPGYLQLAADQVHQDRSPRQHRDPGPADSEGPLGVDQG